MSSTASHARHHPKSMPNTPFVLLLLLLAIICATSISPTSDVPFLSYDTLFFNPDQVLNSSWFRQTNTAVDTSVAWADELRVSGPWSEFHPRHAFPQYSVDMIRRSQR